MNKNAIYDIKVGDIFFINAKSIGIWEIYDSIHTIREIKKTEFRYDDNGHWMSGVLFAVKYIGNNIVEEMTTGEKMILTGWFGKQLLKKSKIRKDKIGPANDYYVPLKFKDFRDNDHDYFDYLNKINGFKKISSNYLLICDKDGDETYAPIRINEETKENYIHTSDESRINFINEAKKQSKENLEAAYKELDEEVERITKVSSEMIEMATLENNLFNFKNKVKVKK